jgi:hypothetical protein
VLATGTAAVKESVPPRRVEGLPPDLQCLSFGMARRGPRGERPEQGGDREVNAEQNERGWNRRHIEPQHLPASYFRQDEHAQHEYGGNGTERSPPALPGQQGAQSQKFRFSSDLEEVNASHADVQTVRPGLPNETGGVRRQCAAGQNGRCHGRFHPLLRHRRAPLA